MKIVLLLLVSFKLFASSGGASKDKGENKLEEFKKDLNSGLLESSYGGDLDNVEFYIKRGADVNFANIGGETPLSVAVQSKNSGAEKVRKLIEIGAKTDQRALFVGNELYPIEFAIISPGDDMRGPIGLDIVEELAKATPSSIINSKASGGTLLHFLVKNVSTLGIERVLALMKILFKYGAEESLNIENDAELTPFQVNETESVKVACLLACFGANINQKFVQQDRTFLDIFIRKNKEMITMSKYYYPVEDREAFISDYTKLLAQRAEPSLTTPIVQSLIEILNEKLKQEAEERRKAEIRRQERLKQEAEERRKSEIRCQERLKQEAEERRKAKIKSLKKREHRKAQKKKNLRKQRKKMKKRRKK